MKKIIAVAIIAAGLCSCISTSFPTNAEFAGLKGKVKSVEESAYNAEQKFGEWSAVGDPYFGNKSYLNKKGLTTILDLYSNGELYARQVTKIEDGKNVGHMVYNADGKLIGEENIEKKWVGIKKYKTTIYNNTSGKKIGESEVSLAGDGQPTKFVTRSFENGIMKRETVKEAEYDKYGNKIKQIIDGRVVIIQNLEFDEKGNCIKQVLIIPDAYGDDESPEIIIRKIEYYE